jgi:hypothetical protein
MSTQLNYEAMAGTSWDVFGTSHVGNTDPHSFDLSTERLDTATMEPVYDPGTSFLQQPLSWDPEAFACMPHYGSSFLSNNSVQLADPGVRAQIHDYHVDADQRRASISAQSQV